jgi:hypothetical protein
MTTLQTMALRIERHDQAHGFDDTVPGDWSIERLTDAAVPKLRLATKDVTSGKPLKYSALHEGTEVPRDAKVATALKPGGKVVIAPEYENARD